MDLTIIIYLAGVAFTMLFLAIAFIVMLVRDSFIKATWNDLGLSILSILGWPIFWVLFISSKLSK